jgi:glycosyltransferase involved in cell wall biosynthesis
MENDTQQPAFSICVPTYNRGFTTLMMVFDILPTMDENWELLILDNASHHEVEGYQQIEALTKVDPRLRYIRHASNRGFHHNFLAAFDHAKSAHIMLISDEDYANSDMIRQVLPELQASPNLAVLRGSIACIKGARPRNVCNYPNMRFSKGEVAMLYFCLNNTYMSGVIYNRELLVQSGVIELLRGGINDNSIYPHLYLELLACALFDAATTEEISCHEGEEKPTLGNRAGDYAPPYSFGSRVDQFIVLRSAIRQAIALMPGDFDNHLFIMMYLELCKRYMRLISQVNSPLYIKNKLHLGLLQDSLFEIFGAAIFAYPDLVPYEEYLFTEIHKIYASYKIKENATVENNGNETIAA